MMNRTACRLCKHDTLLPAVDLGLSALANEYVARPIKQDEFPLNLVICARCGHCQLGFIVDPTRLYRNYRYASGVGKTLRKHFEEAAETIADRVGLLSNDLVVSIGSNDGTDLQPYLVNRNCRVIGVDPAHDLAASASAEGIETWAEFFTEKTGKQIDLECGKATLVVANNVFVHTDTADEIVAGVKACLAPGGTFVFEVAFVGAMLDNADLSSVYHEHVGYGAITPFAKFFQGHGMSLVDFDWIPTHGGSIRGYVKHGDLPASEAVIEQIRAEVEADIFEPQTYAMAYEQFMKNGETVKRLLDDAVVASLNGGNPAAEIYVFGCPAKWTTMSYCWGLDKLITSVIDDSPWKQGLLTPGQHLPIESSETIVRHPPTAILLGAWNMKDALVARLRNELNYRGPIINPLPTPELIND